MAKRRTLVTATLNIELPKPHQKQRYIELFRKIFEFKRAVRVYGDTHLVIERVHFDEEDKIIYGNIGKFTNIDRNAPWFDLDSLSEADEKLTRQISIPQSLRPNYKSIYFAFVLKEHKLIFENIAYDVSVSPKQMQKLFIKLFEDGQIIEEFGTVSVSLIQTREGLDKIFALKAIKYIRIEYARPNSPDDHGAMEEEIERRLEEQNASKEILELEANGSMGLKPNAETMARAAVALSHGKIDVTEKDLNGKMVTKSSEDHPLLEYEKYDPDFVSPDQAFQRVVNKRLSV